MKRGLVLEGGALRGLFSAGVIDVMMEHDVRFDGIVGVSAGAAFGCNYKSHQAGRAIRYNKRFAREWRYCSLRSLITTGDLFGADFAYHIVPTQYDVFDNETFEKDPTKYYVVCSDVVTGKPVYHLCMKGGDHTFDWIRASASMPVCSRIVELDGMKLLDGGMTDSIPLAFMQLEGYKRNVVVLTQPEGYVKKPNPLMPIVRIALRRYPAIVEAMARRHEMYNAQTAFVKEQEKAGNTFVIRPPLPLPIGHTSHNPDEMQHVYDIGRQTAQELLPQLLSFLQNTQPSVSSM